MNKAERPQPGGDSPDGPGSGADGGEPDRGESWFDKLRAAVRLRPSASFREDLEVALAADDVTAGFSPEERAMLANILRLRDVRVDDVMVPRADIDATDIDVPIGALLASFRESGHSRMPVYRETLDDPVGLIHIKDLMGFVTNAALAMGDGEQSSGFDLSRVDLSKSLAEAGLVRNILFVPPSMPIAVLLANMQASRMQMALVIDEYGGTDGLVSLEDAVEMVVGDIEDEHDDETGPMIVADGESGFFADARADLDDVSAVIGTDLAVGDDSEDVDTIGGLVFSLIGRIPVRGELVSGPNGYEFEILDADPRRIKRLRIYRRVAGRTEARRRQRHQTEPTSGA
jgi:CBS domain containing-hemolysin-like protein